MSIMRKRMARKQRMTFSYGMERKAAKTAVFRAMPPAWAWPLGATLPAGLAGS